MQQTTPRPARRPQKRSPFQAILDDIGTFITAFWRVLVLPDRYGSYTLQPAPARNVRYRRP